MFVDNKEKVVPPGRESEKANSNENLAHKANQLTVWKCKHDTHSAILVTN